LTVLEKVKKLLMKGQVMELTVIIYPISDNRKGY